MGEPRSKTSRTVFSLSLRFFFVSRSYLQRRLPASVSSNWSFFLDGSRMVIESIFFSASGGRGRRRSPIRFGNSVMSFPFLSSQYGADREGGKQIADRSLGEKGGESLVEYIHRRIHYIFSTDFPANPRRHDKRRGVTKTRVVKMSNVLILFFSHALIVLGTHLGTYYLPTALIHTLLSPSP